MSIYCETCAIEVEAAYEINGTFCSVCGNVLESQIFDNSSTFMNIGSSTVAVGTVTSGAGDNLLRNLPGGVTNSREMTINRAQRRIEGLANRLDLPSYISEHALNVYKMALQFGLTKGRKGRHIAAACLYIACRAKKTPHMLMDFSEALEEDVFIIGHCYLKLTEKLNLPLPICEPFFYLRRFCAQLEFEEKYNTVVNTALHLVSAMKRDWMQTGRRPAGICAAAILISARIHGFKRTQEEVVRVARICGATLAKRLKEFDQTEAAQMTPTEFISQAEALELGQLDYRKLEQNPPPAFIRSEEQKKRKLALERMQKKYKEVDVNENFNETISSNQINTQPETSSSSITNNMTHTQSIDSSQHNTIANNDNSISRSSITHDTLREMQQITQTEEVRTLDDDFNFSSVNFSDVTTSSRVVINEETHTAISNLVEIYNEDEENNIQAVVNEEQDGEQEGEQEGGESTLTDISDAEINEYLVTDDAEIKLREEIWDSLNLQFLKEMEEKRKEKERIRAEKELEPRTIRKRKRAQEETPAPARSAAEAAAALLRAKFSRSHIPGIDLGELFTEEPIAEQENTVDEHGYGSIDIVHEESFTRDINNEYPLHDYEEERFDSPNNKRLRNSYY
jgi:transcription factor IIIB subunit 2